MGLKELVDNRVTERINVNGVGCWCLGILLCTEVAGIVIEAKALVFGHLHSIYVFLLRLFLEKVNPFEILIHIVDSFHLIFVFCMHFFLLFF